MPASERPGPTPAVESAPASDAEASALAERTRRAKLRAILAWITLGCLLLAAAGFAFIRWAVTRPPG